MQTRQQAVELLVERLNAKGIPSEWNVIPSFEGFNSVTRDRATDVYSVEAHLGPSPNHPGYSSYAVTQTFCPDYPNMALVFLTDLRDGDKKPRVEPATFNIEIDRKFSTIVLPLLFTGFNDLDPTRQRRGLLVQSYNSDLTLGDLFLASLYTWKLVTTFKRDGQLALIAVDYYDPLIKAIAAIVTLGQRIFGGDIRHVPRTKELSSIKIPIRADGGYHLLDRSSTALDRGFAIARSYLDGHILQSTNSLSS